MHSGKRITSFLLIALVVLLPGMAKGTGADEDRVGREMAHAFKAIVALWKEERYENLYEQGRLESKRLISKQNFVRLMRDSNVRLQCCWATVQNIKGIASSQTGIYVKATLGFEHFSPVLGEPEPLFTHRLMATSAFKEETFLFNRERERWKIDLMDILAAVGYVFKHPLILKTPLPLTIP